MVQDNNKDLKKIIKVFLKEHNRFMKEFDIDFISIRSNILPLIEVYTIIDNLFKNNSIFLKENDLILLTLTSIGILSKENKDTLKKLIKEIKFRKLSKYYPKVKKSIIGIRIVLNMIFKKDGAVIQNIEQGIKYEYSIDILSILSEYIKNEGIKLNDFSYWFITDKLNKKSKNLIDYLHIEYYV